MKILSNIFSSPALLIGYVILGTTLASPVNTVSMSSQPVISERKDPEISSDWSSIGCWSDNHDHRTLRNYKGFPPVLQPLTIELCKTTCYTYGFVLAGVESGADCWCDNEVQGTTSKVADSYCKTPCAGDSQEMCGGDYVVNIYTYILTASTTAMSAPTTSTIATSSTNVPSPSPIAVPGTYISQGCYTDSTSRRTLGTPGDFPGAHEGMTIELCQAACQHAGYVLAGVEFGHECWCDNALHGIGAQVSDSDCNIPCNGNASKICGGSNRINVYSFTPTLTTATTSTTPTTTTSSSSSTIYCAMYYKVAEGEYCYDIWTRFRISQEQFTSWNPSLVWPDPLLTLGQLVCVQQGPIGSSILTVTGIPAMPT